MKYDFKHPEELYKEAIEYYGGKVNNMKLWYVNINTDDQNKLKEILEDNDQIYMLNNLIYVNILMNIDYGNENKWLLCKGCCNPFYGSFPYLLFNINMNNDEIIESIFNYLMYYCEIRKVCNSCDESAEYNCPDCDNMDFCEKCMEVNKHEQIHMEKIDDSEKNKELCDVCGKAVPTYSNNKYYYLCDKCFSDNPHKNHKLIKIKDNNNLINDNELIIVIKKKLYMHFASIILFDTDKKNKWDLFETNGVCLIFNNDNEEIKNRVKKLKINGGLITELKKIEMEFSQKFDCVIRKYFIYDFNKFNFLYGNRIPFTGSKTIIDFYYGVLKMINDVKNKKYNKQINSITDENDLIEL
jgi:hypothetical protein